MKGSSARPKYAVTDSKAAVPRTARRISQRMDRKSGRIARRSNSTPAVRAISAMAIPLKMRRLPVITLDNRFRTPGPATMPARMYPVRRGRRMDSPRSPAKKAVSSRYPNASAVPAAPLPVPGLGAKEAAACISPASTIRRSIRIDQSPAPWITEPEATGESDGACELRKKA